MNKTREEAEKIIFDTLHRHQSVALREIPTIQQQILDELYPKPESERLKDLKLIQKRVDDALQYQSSVIDFQGTHYVQILSELNYEAIKAEKAKP